LRGARGYFGLLKHFKNTDEEGSNLIKKQDFVKAFRDFRIEVDDLEVD